MEKFIIGNEVVPVIAHDPVKCLSTKIIQTAAFAGYDAPSFTAINQDRENQDPKQPDLCSPAQILTLPNTEVKGIHHGGRYSQASIDFCERSFSAANRTSKVYKTINK